MIRRKPGAAFGGRTALWFTIAAGFAFFTLIFSNLPFFSVFQDAALAVAAPAQRAVRAVASPMGDFAEHFGGFGALKTENDSLQAENARLTAETARFKEKEIALNDLTGLLDVKLARPNDKFMAATIVARSTDRYERAVAINRGERDGVRKEMVVIAPAGSIVGRISSVLPDFAWVTLLSDPGSNVPAMGQDSRVEGVLAGRGDDSMRLELLPRDGGVKTGEIIMTSGLAGGFPRGIPLGRVIDVAGSDQDLAPAVYVGPLASMRNLENVLILVSFVPSAVPVFGTISPATAGSGQAAPAAPDAGAAKRPAEAVLPGSSR
ncbi:MAG: rod shape-determining protein MreC [Dehalococcoidia bacterium]|nr:rod shape-determining protein MreC [Dehalococcoidia bacterium]